MSHKENRLRLWQCRVYIWRKKETKHETGMCLISYFLCELGVLFACSFWLKWWIYMGVIFSILYFPKSRINHILNYALVSICRNTRRVLDIIAKQRIQRLTVWFIALLLNQFTSLRVSNLSFIALKKRDRICSLNE